MTQSTYSELSKGTIRLHWIVGIMMILLLATGIYMEETETFALYPWHKSFGVLVLLFALVRIAWRIRKGWLNPVGAYSSIEKNLSKLIHWLLIVATVILPVSGFMMSVMGGHGADFFGLELVGRNINPDNPREVIPLNESLAGMAHTVHGLGGNLLLFALSLHVMGAFKHHLVDKDSTLRRMIGVRAS